MINIFKTYCFIAGLLLAAGVSAQDAQNDKSSSPPATQNGAQLWANNCGTCHNLRSPSGYSDSQWDVATQHMRIRANLPSEDIHEIVEFLKSAN